jgi:hypothetical protein
MYRSVAGVPGIRIGEIVDSLGVELPKDWRARFTAKPEVEG